MNNFLRALSIRSHWIAMAGLALLVIVFLGPSLPGFTLLLLIAIGGGGLYWWQRTPVAKATPITSPANFATLLKGERPTIVEFYSDFCSACLANRPLVDSLEAELGQRAKLVRINLRSPEGRKLAEEYNITFTPTFMLFNRAGQKEDEFLYALSRSRVLHWLDRQP